VRFAAFGSGNIATGPEGPFPVASRSRDSSTMNYARISDALRALLFEPGSGADLD
jgi:hypothetical protein